MSKFSIDYSTLQNNIYKNAYKLSDVKDHLEVVAFDVVRFKDGDKAADLWQVQSADDGEYIVALYQTDEEKAANHWSVELNKTAGTIQVFYKGDALVNLASNKLGIPTAEVHKVKEYLPSKLAENKKLVKALLNELSVPVRKAVFEKYPELV
jgi:hypothetical protein